MKSSYKNITLHLSSYRSTHDEKFVITRKLNNTSEQNDLICRANSQLYWWHSDIKIFHLANPRCDAVVGTRLLNIGSIICFTVKLIFIFSQTVGWQFASRCLFAPVASWSLSFSRSYYWTWKLSRCMKPLTSARISTWMKRHDTSWKKNATKNPLQRQCNEYFRKLKDAIDFFLSRFVSDFIIRRLVIYTLCNSPHKVSLNY